MRGLRAFCMRFMGMFRPRSRERDLADEIESNIALMIEEHIRAGVDPKEARRRVILQFGNCESTKQACREQLGLPVVKTVKTELFESERIA